MTYTKTYFMRIFFSIIILFACLPSFSQQSPFSGSLPKIEGGSIQLSSFSGKKLLVITLPVIQSSSADSLLFALDTVSYGRQQTLQVIAVPSFEDGFSSAYKEQLKSWYRSILRAHVIITDGLQTRKSSGAQQHAMFKWLTHNELNENYDVDADSPGMKYFVSVDRVLYGVLSPHSTLWGRSVQRTLAQ